MRKNLIVWIMNGFGSEHARYPGWIGIKSSIFKG